MLIYADLFDHILQGARIETRYAGYMETGWLTRQVFPSNLLVYYANTYTSYNYCGLFLPAGALGGNCINFYRRTTSLGDGGYMTAQMPLLVVNKTAKHYFAFRVQRDGGAESETLFAIDDGFYSTDTAPTATMKVLYVKADGTLSFGGVDSASPALSSGIYTLIEVEIDPVGDIINVYADKNLVITKSASGWFANGLRQLGIMYWNGQGLNSSSSVGIRFDDILCWDYTGTGVFSSYPTGVLKVTATPINSTDSDQWDNIGGAASKLDALIDQNSTGEFNPATYAAAHTAGKKDTFGVDGSAITGTPVAVVCAPVISQSALSSTPFVAVEFEDLTASESQDITWQNPGGTPGCPPIPFHIEQAPSGGALDLSVLKVGYKT
jgi:hypothetical protein